uniref:Uncharacterized protein n=1 Tax=Anopheles braziliensis TaxID=58242 RepID=A0A2M3ZM25_9DIPT
MVVLILLVSGLLLVFSPLRMLYFWLSLPLTYKRAVIHRETQTPLQLQLNRRTPLTVCPLLVAAAACSQRDDDDDDNN